jgi:stage III sporulation protein SpoIIIAA
MLIAEDFENLLKVSPQFVQNSSKEDPNVDSLVDIVLDIGRISQASFLNRHVFLADQLIKLKDILLVNGTRATTTGSSNL